MRRSRLCLLGLVGVAALGLAGCGGSSTPSKSSKSSAGSQPYGYSKSTATSSAATKAGAVTVTTKNVAVYGAVLAAGSNRRTVYMFAADKGESSSCNGACAQAWPPLTAAGAPKAAGGASVSKLSTITRSDGSRQVTYAGHPLYFYVADKTEPDVLGEGVVSFGAAWYALSPSGAVIKKP